MCGIAGQISFGSAEAFQNTDKNHSEIEMTKKMADIMLERLKYRGPDSKGMVSGPNFTFAHTRLKIFDLSDKSAQPMHDKELKLWITFNGAIYNYKDLRIELKANGYNFHSDGDTEVILKAYHAWGEKCLDRFHGMFAFAIHDETNQEYFFARDRLGIKPLYYYKDKERLIFSSNLPSIIDRGDVSISYNPKALHTYMSFHAISPMEETIFNEIKKVPPGHFIKLSSRGELKVQRYWSIYKIPMQDISFDDAKVELEERLLKAVERRMVADVEVGVLLSGGLDSSLVVGLLHHLGHRKIKTFSIGFESVGDTKGDEFYYSDIIARKFETSHIQLKIPTKDTLTYLKEAFFAMNEPMVSHDNIGFYLISREVKKHVKVVQSGQGADEVFGGYHWYPPLLKQDGGLDQYQRLFFDREHSEVESLFKINMQKDYSRECIEEMFAEMEDLTTIDKALRVDTSFMLAEDPVKRVDSMTSHWGLEARVPFLDHELVEFSMAIPAEYKVQGGGKHILKEVARDFIPADVIDRPKGYFPVPALKYIQGPYLDFVKKYLSKDNVEKRGLYNWSEIEKLLLEPEKHISLLGGSKLWQACVLEAWLHRQNIDLRGDNIGENRGKNA